MIELIKPRLPDLTSVQKYYNLSISKNTYANFGPCYELFQTKIKDFLNLSNKPVLNNNATDSLEICIRAFGIKNSEIICPTFTFAATAAAILRSGNTPVYCDSNYSTFHINVLELKKVITKKTKAIIVVHPLGLYANTGAFNEFAKANNLKLIYDAAPAFGSFMSPEESGDAQVFSFHCTKTIGIGEGSCITSKNPEFLELCRKISNFGLNDKAESVIFGLNSKLSELQCAMGCAVMDEAPSKLSKRRNLAKIYNENLSNKFSPQNQGSLKNHTYPFFPTLYLGEPEYLRTLLAKNAIGFRQYYKPLHLHTNFLSKSSYPTAEYIYANIFCLPCHEFLSETNIREICEIIK